MKTMADDPNRYETKNYEWEREGDRFYKTNKETGNRQRVEEDVWRLNRYNARPEVAIPGEGRQYRHVEVDYQTASRVGELANNPDSNETVEIDGRTYTAQEIADAFKRATGDPIRYE